MKFILAIVLGATLGVQPISQGDDPLEMSVQNEVDRAIGLGEKWLEAQSTNVVGILAGDYFKTNGLTRTQIAVRLVSVQRRPGWWGTDTNTAPTRFAIDILKGL